METEPFVVSIGITIVLFFATLLLTSQKYKSRPNRFLAASLITLSLLMLRIHSVLEGTIFSELLDFLRIEYVFAVFLYIYILEILNVKIPKITLILLFSPFLFFSSLYLFSHVFEGTLEHILEITEGFETYMVIGFNMFVITSAIVKVYQSSVAMRLKKWLYLISASLLAVMLFFLMLEFAELLFDVNFWDSFGIVMTLFFVGTSYVGIQQLQIQQEQEAIQKVYRSTKKSDVSTKSAVTLNHYAQMQALMLDEQLFREASLDREVFAEKLGLSASSVTRILKEEGQTNFKDFINHYRIQLAKEMLIDVRFHVFSLEAIGKEAGFKSRSTFYETFKKEVGISPGAFKKNACVL
ncbi:MAG: helix-turn-helix transcriptional regulator [Bacteroidota bacterium]